MTLTRRLKGYNRFTYNMSEENTEQITKEPDVKIKVKDPKRVKAGKAIQAKRNEAMAYYKREQEKKEAKSNKKDESGVNDWLPSLSFQNVLTLGSIGLAAYAIFTNYRDRIPDLHIPVHNFNPPPPKIMDNSASQPPKE